MTQLRIPAAMAEEIVADLRRPHAFVEERVGFLLARPSPDGGAVQLAWKYMPVEDDNYVPDALVGARFNNASIRTALQAALEHDAGCFHVHLHDWEGPARLSHTDEACFESLLPPFTRLVPHARHGALLFTADRFSGAEWNVNHQRLQPIDVSVVGFPLRKAPAKPADKTSGEQFSRQAFLGVRAQEAIAQTRVGVVGLSGGGGPVFESLLLSGFRLFSLFDPKVLETKHRSRSPLCTDSDIRLQRPKVVAARRHGLLRARDAKIDAYVSCWQDNAAALQQCDVVIGCVDTFAERYQLEVETRRYLIPYIDLGLDFHEDRRLDGQVALSMPGHACFQCLNVISERKLALEAAHYGPAPKQQIAWANGCLANMGVGLLLELICDRTQSERGPFIRKLQGNEFLVTKDPRTAVDLGKCPHFPLGDVGPPATLLAA